MNPNDDRFFPSDMTAQMDSCKRRPFQESSLEVKEVPTFRLLNNRIQANNNNNINNNNYSCCLVNNLMMAINHNRLVSKQLLLLSHITLQFIAVVYLKH